MGVTIQDAELLIQFRNPDTKEKGFTAIIKKYQEKLYWHIRRMVVDHEDARSVPFVLARRRVIAAGVDFQHEAGGTLDDRIFG